MGNKYILPYYMSNPIFTAYTQADLFGKLIFISIFALSITTWTLFLKKVLHNKKIKATGSDFLEIFQKNRLQPLGLEVKNADNPFSLLYSSLKRASYEILHKNSRSLGDGAKVYLSRTDISLIEQHLLATISTETNNLEKNLYVLSTIAALAPFLGLLGTVWGILITFSELQKGGAVQGNDAMLGGLAMALGTTVLGLVVAIPALIGYNYLKAKLYTNVREMENFSHLLLTNLELQYRKVDLP